MCRNAQEPRINYIQIAPLELWKSLPVKLLNVEVRLLLLDTLDDSSMLESYGAMRDELAT